MVRAEQKGGFASSSKWASERFCFPWIHREELVCVSGDFNLSTNYYRINPTCTDLAHSIHTASS